MAKKEVIEVIEESSFTFELKSVKWFSGRLKPLKDQVMSAEFKARKTQKGQDLLKLKELREEYEREIKRAKIAGYKKRLSEKCQIIIDNILFNKYGIGYPIGTIGWYTTNGQEQKELCEIFVSMLLYLKSPWRSANNYNGDFISFHSQQFSKMVFLKRSKV